MPRITVKTNVFLNREKKYRMTLEFKESIELIPCEKGSFVMADFEDEAFMLFGDEAASDPCAAIEVQLSRMPLINMIRRFLCKSLQG